MGKKGTSINIQAVSGVYMLLTTLCSNTSDRVAAVRADAKYIQDTISDAEVDKETKEQLEEQMNEITSAWDLVTAKFKAIQKIVNDVLGKVMEADKRAKSGLSASQENLKKTKSGIAKL